MQRAHSTQRSRSSATCAEMGRGLTKRRLSSTKREPPGPWASAWSCSGHSPPLSHWGQSSGWLISRNSSWPRCPSRATSLVRWVLTTMPSVQVVEHAVMGLRCPSTSTRHWRQAATGSSSGWSQKRGIVMPSRSAARITSIPLGTSRARPSMVTVTRSVRGWTSVIGCSPGPPGWEVGGGPSSRSRCPRAARCPAARRGARSGAGTRRGSTSGST